MAGQQVEALNPRARRAIWGAFGGFLVDGFDVYLPILALAPALAYFFSPEIPASTAAILTALAFVATLIGRPTAGRDPGASRKLEEMRPSIERNAPSGE